MIRFALILAFFLSACAFSYSPLPSNVVMLTALYPAIEGRCTGAVIDPTHVLTAAHCTKSADRVITPLGQEAFVTSYDEWKTEDIAILEVDRALFVQQFAELGRAELGVIGNIFGTCPYYWGHQSRLAAYNGMVEVPLVNGKIRDYDQWIVQPRMGDNSKACGGDSGGVVMQGNKVVGVISAVDSDYWFVAIGTVMYAVPGDIVKDLMTSDQATASVD